MDSLDSRLVGTSVLSVPGNEREIDEQARHRCIGWRGGGDGGVGHYGMKALRPRTGCGWQTITISR